MVHVVAKKWLFSIGNGAENLPLEKGRKSPAGCDNVLQPDLRSDEDCN